MSIKKFGAVACAVALVASLAALAGCSGSSASSSSSSSSSAQSVKLLTDGTLTVGTSPDFPPFENLENGEYVGLDIEIAKAVAKEMNLKCEFKTLQFDGIIPAVSAGGQVDMGISGFTVDPDRAKQVDFSDTYYIDDQAVATMKSSAITTENVDTELNKEGMIIAVQSGTTGETYAQENYPKATVQAYGNSTDCFAAMQSGQATAVCTNKAVVDQMLSSAYTDAQVVKNVATGEEYAMVISKDNPELTKQINAALKKLQDDGTIDSLTKQFM